jgi:hypothetical protein
MNRIIDWTSGAKVVRDMTAAEIAAIPAPSPPILTKPQFEGLLASVKIGPMLFEDVWNAIEAGAKSAGLAGDDVAARAQARLYAQLRAERVMVQFRLEVTRGYVALLSPVIHQITGHYLTDEILDTAWYRAAGQ